MPETAGIEGRTPTAPCRCGKPDPGIVLEDKDGKIIEMLCARCRGAIRPQEELGDDWMQYAQLFPIFSNWGMP
jgi:hypothetical protein